MLPKLTPAETAALLRFLRAWELAAMEFHDADYALMAAACRVQDGYDVYHRITSAPISLQEAA